MNLMLIDDNPQVLEVFSDALKSDFEVATFNHQENAMEFLKDNSVDAILLDLHMPGKNGFEVFRDLKSIKPDLPILFITSESGISYKVQGLQLGADDFICKPIEIEELKARILNRIMFSKKSKSNSSRIQIKELFVDAEAKEVLLKGKRIKLTPKEFQIIYLLVQRPNKVIPKDEFVQLLWKGEPIEVNNIDTHFSNLRKKLNPFSDYIKTLKNLGYVLRI
jgi:DNA-binding response OmpR family regulator